MLVSAMESGNTYVNIHTQGIPDGEIRGQIKGTFVPVGGTTSFLTGSPGSSSGNITLVAGVSAALVVAIAAGGWYTRRRWLGSRS